MLAMVSARCLKLLLWHRGELRGRHNRRLGLRASHCDDESVDLPDMYPVALKAGQTIIWGESRRICTRQCMQCVHVALAAGTGTAPSLYCMTIEKFERCRC
jgi:hypothetical protein